MKAHIGVDSRTLRYRALAKHGHRLFVTCALSKLVIAKKTPLKRNRMEFQG